MGRHILCGKTQRKPNEEKPESQKKTKRPWWRSKKKDKDGEDRREDDEDVMRNQRRPASLHEGYAGDYIPQPLPPYMDPYYRSIPLRRHDRPVSYYELPRTGPTPSQSNSLNGTSVITGGSASTFSPPVIPVPGRIAVSTSHLDDVFRERGSYGRVAPEDSYSSSSNQTEQYDSQSALKYQNNSHVFSNPHLVGRTSSLMGSVHTEKDMYTPISQQSRRTDRHSRILNDIHEDAMTQDRVVYYNGSNSDSKEMERRRREHHDYKYKCRELEAEREAFLNQIKLLEEKLSKEKEETSEWKKKASDSEKRFNDLQKCHEKYKSEDASRMLEQLKMSTSTLNTPTDRDDTDPDLTLPVSSVVITPERPPLFPISQSFATFQSTPTIRNGHLLSRRPTSLLSNSAASNRSSLLLNPSTENVNRVHVVSTKDLSNRSTSTTPDSGAVSINGECLPEIAYKIEEFRHKFIVCRKTMAKLIETVEELLKADFCNVSNFLYDDSPFMTLSSDAKRLTQEDILLFFNEHDKVLSGHSDQIEKLQLLLIEITHNKGSQCNIQ